MFSVITLIVITLITGEVDGQESPGTSVMRADAVAELQSLAQRTNFAEWGFWGIKPDVYSGWTKHSNRLIPIYTFGTTFDRYMHDNSIYRDQTKLDALYRYCPDSTCCQEAAYADQTDVYRLQRDAVESLGKKYVFLIIFDGMDWQTTQAAAIHAAGNVAYTQGRGTGLTFQDYDKTVTDFGYFVTSPHDEGILPDVDQQTAILTGPIQYGGYNPKLGGFTPWDRPPDFVYPTGRSLAMPHAYTDSSSSATSMMSGSKVFNGSVNVMHDLSKTSTIADWLQSQKGFKVGVVTSVPICHATPAAAYAHNVSRDDYQDLTRDMLGLPSISHPKQPLSGLDVVIGSGWGVEVATTPTGLEEERLAQGRNLTMGNRYLTEQDLYQATHRAKSPYIAALRTPGETGKQVLEHSVKNANLQHKRLLGFFGTRYSHLPFATANGDFRPVRDVNEAENYSRADIDENPTLAQMSKAAIEVLDNNRGFWLMIEAGDVDWANHANNIDNSIGAVLSGDAAVSSVFDWIESKDAWKESLVIVTADHGHYFNIVRPEVFASP